MKAGVGGGGGAAWFGRVAYIPRSLVGWLTRATRNVVAAAAAEWQSIGDAVSRLHLHSPAARLAKR